MDVLYTAATSTRVEERLVDGALTSTDTAYPRRRGDPRPPGTMIVGECRRSYVGHDGCLRVELEWDSL